MAPGVRRLMQFVSCADWFAQRPVDAGQAIPRLQPLALRARVAAPLPDNATALALQGRGPRVANRTIGMLFVHDLLDTISPLLESESLHFGTTGRQKLSICPQVGFGSDWSKVEVAYAPFNPGYDEGSAVLLSQTYLLLWLHSDLPVVRLPYLGDVDAMFAPLHEEHLRGANLDTFLRPRLLEPCDPRSTLARDEDDFQSAESGCAFLARRLRTHWGYDVHTQAKSSSSSTTMA